MTDAIVLTNGEKLTPHELAQVQRRRWETQLSYVVARSAFYRSRGFSESTDSRLEAIAELPFTSKEDLREDQRRHPPFGSYLAIAPHTLGRVHRTSGTTGVAMNLALTAADAGMTALIGARAQRAAGLGPGHRVVHCLNYQLWMGGFTDHTTLEATGATVVPFGVGDSTKLLKTIRELGITAISCTPSYPAVLEKVIARDFTGLNPVALGLKLGLFGGEAGLDDPGFRMRLENTWGFKARNANYGVSDVLCNFAGQTEIDNDLHFMAPEVLYAELIDPESGQVKPWQEGQSGELVLTHLAKQSQPLIRFRSGDVITLTGLGQAACGRTTPRFRVIGRCDDMVVVRGINVFPTMVAALLHDFTELNGEYRIMLAGEPPFDKLPLEVELIPGRQASDELQSVVERRIKSSLGVSAEVRLLEAWSLPRTEGKTRRVVRKANP